MNYPEAVRYLFEELPAYQLAGGDAYKPGLERVVELAETLDNPQLRFPSIHVAGTNGKGSTCSILAAVLTAHGYKTGLYTSPHLLDFRERIRIDGKPIEVNDVVRFVEGNRPTFDKVKPSFFEATTMMAFDHFARQEVDIAIIETGLGGRLDATNILDPVLAIITPISFDHKDILGDDILSIAREKAGIIKEDLDVIIGYQSHSIGKSWYELSGKETARFYSSWKLCQMNRRTHRMDGFKMGVSFELGEEHEFDLGLGGQVQEGNVQMALAAMYRLGQNGFKFDVEAILRGLENVKELSGIRGRLDVVSEKPLVVCDVAHNEEALRLLFPHITRFHEIDHIIYSCTNDRDLNEFIPTFPEGAVLHFVRSSNPRLTDPKELLEIGERADFECYAYDSVAEGIESVLQKNPSCLVITGSNFLVAEALEFPWP